MSVNYPFAPCPSFGLGEHCYSAIENIFTEQELNDVRALEPLLGITQASVAGYKAGESSDLDNIRSSAVGWLPHNETTDWLYHRMAMIAMTLNGRDFDFDLYGFTENFQYTVYRPKEEFEFETKADGHYGWHIDMRRTNNEHMTPRKLSLVLQLSDPSEYEGGVLQLHAGGTPIDVPKKKGLVVAFPSYVLHQVTPVTSGVRRTLVSWITGPRFK